ncbi:hypothetical protein CAOG_00502 [Capsaspora owczarzaki ATCC 30864]|uniref:Uncharacterized protein n=1 Tax=Capsaspora owczarzaki (strain ATCC 30864) TaxID=595528 RepID=A0A0D2X0E8_CAPO3|nr:hypothetical protein CAOG_00502 [Capsaspora owczarzaki ATCC 30864]KJE88934.1 hypothetical protein CAOG_000502 [Capsaspora owczarzaki ATCC 30864]|eukprot:XP_004365373.1 hypothetical protein CAOG_00502 [Capsaspora owczarzaki ATCC 30864]
MQTAKSAKPTISPRMERIQAQDVHVRARIAACAARAQAVLDLLAKYELAEAARADAQPAEASRSGPSASGAEQAVSDAPSETVHAEATALTPETMSAGFSEPRGQPKKKGAKSQSRASPTNVQAGRQQAHASKPTPRPDSAAVAHARETLVHAWLVDHLLQQSGSVLAHFPYVYEHEWDASGSPDGGRQVIPREQRRERLGSGDLVLHAASGSEFAVVEVKLIEFPPRRNQIEKTEGNPKEPCTSAPPGHEDLSPARQAAETETLPAIAPTSADNATETSKCDASDAGGDSSSKDSRLLSRQQPNANTSRQKAAKLREQALRYGEWWMRKHPQAITRVFTVTGASEDCISELGAYAKGAWLPVVAL